jgi:hypothetical protein
MAAEVSPRLFRDKVNYRSVSNPFGNCQFMPVGTLLGPYNVAMKPGLVEQRTGYHKDGLHHEDEGLSFYPLKSRVLLEIIFPSCCTEISESIWVSWWLSRGYKINRF